VFSRRQAPHPGPESFWLGVPVLGICYGIQLMGHLLGGQVANSEAPRIRPRHADDQKPGKLFAGLPKKLRVWNSHGDKLIKLPPGFRRHRHVSDNSPFSVIEDRKRNFYGIQFHPEVFHTERGVDMIKNFLVGVCGAKQDWTTKDFIAQSVADIRSKVGKSRVLLGLSGGVDSSVAAALLHRPSASSSPACSSTTACSAKASARQSSRSTPGTSRSTCASSMRRRSS
jgi:GMP synthase (glutamine-hydrolysing)